MNDLRFEVRFSTREEGVPVDPWEPVAGDGVTCSKREALRRFDYLTKRSGEAQPKVEGLQPCTIEIVGADDGILRLGFSADLGVCDADNVRSTPWSNLYGPWADLVRDDFVWPVDPIVDETEMA